LRIVFCTWRPLICVLVVLRALEKTSDKSALGLFVVAAGQKAKKPKGKRKLARLKCIRISCWPLRKHQAETEQHFACLGANVLLRGGAKSIRARRRRHSRERERERSGRDPTFGAADATYFSRFASPQ
jgi:hypothetical protein